MVTLPYGRAPYPLDLRGREATIVELPAPPPAVPVRPLLDVALANPIGLGPVESLVPPGGRVTVIVSDRTRHEPRSEFLAALRARLPDRRWTLAIATGTHGPAGVKAVFPGLGAARDVRHNHELKQAPGARAGIVDGNPCRSDLEAAVAMLPSTVFLLNGVCAADGSVFAAVAGDPRIAFRRGVELARPQFTVRAEPADLVIASDVLPVTASLYQASKIAAAMAPLVKPAGLLLLVAECADGIGGLEVVNEKILRIGILPRLAPGARLGLASSLDDSIVRTTLLDPITIDEALNNIRGSVLVAPRASQMLVS